jgi:hypothetical protein
LFKPLFPCFTSRHSLHLASSVSMLDWLNLSLLAENGSEILPLLFTAVCTAHSRCLIKLCRVNGKKKRVLIILANLTWIYKHYSFLPATGNL